jgi:hypothetical protein
MIIIELLLALGVASIFGIAIYTGYKMGQADKKEDK